MKSKINRRNFLTTFGVGAIASQVLPLDSLKNEESFSTVSNTGESPKYWVDPRFAQQKKMPWRKVHLDFHNSNHVANIGADFNADEWGKTIADGNLDSIVVFAKDMHGYSYYPSKYGPVHPGLSFDLLGEQVKACKERNIAVYAYYCAAWDVYMADAHPEWNMLRPDGTDYRAKPGEVAYFSALCLGNKDCVDFMARHIQEFVSKYEIDGAWLDMAAPTAPECYCKVCIEQIQESGKDPYNKEDQRAHQNKNFLEFHRRMRELVHTIRPGCHVDFNDIGLGKLSERADFLDNIDVEALPTGPWWGYFFAPVQLRYQRNFGLPVYGMTGRFVSSWADFGGLKLPQQLDVELASLVANGARCDVGDQMPPSGKLDACVYYVIGKSFGRIKQIEPFLNQAAPLTEAVLLIPDIALEIPSQPHIAGTAKLLIESHIQFDVLEPGMDWERYNLVVIPDEFKPDEKTVGRLQKYIEKGGAVIACHNGGLQADTNMSWLEDYGMYFEGQSPFKPAYFVTETGFVNDMPGYPYALYNGASQWKIKNPAQSLVKLGEPLFNRSPEHFTSHLHWPFDHVTEYSALAVNKNLGLIGFPVGSSYFDKGYWIYRSAFQKLINSVLPNRIIETNAPITTEITVTFQEAEKETKRPKRFLVHVINWSATRKTPMHPEVHEDPVPLTDIWVRLNIPLKNVKVSSAITGNRLNAKSKQNGIEVEIPKVSIHEIVVFEMA